MTDTEMRLRCLEMAMGFMDDGLDHSDLQYVAADLFAFAQTGEIHMTVDAPDDESRH